MTYKKLILSTLGLATIISLSACSGQSSKDTEDKVKDKGTLVVAVSPDYAPFEFQTLQNGKNTIVGADISLAQDIAKELDVKLKLSPMSFNNVLSSLQSGKADIAISGISYTKERAKVYDFSDSYYDTENAIVIKKENADKLKDIASLAGKKVGAQKASIQENLAKNQLKDSNIVSLTDMGEVVNELKNGQLDAITMDGPVATGFVAKNKDLMVVNYTFKTNNADSKVVAMPKGSSKLKKTINKVVKKVKGNTFKSYIDKAATYTEAK
ncbi:amino acid ABC transporter substrate-binding protein [Streptococcus penaeicida]|uniref:Amino acid ABC transporter substrate-binding protein n=1 Tax=Streptococcus penaeicida TaxID=1765960 RepID=A0A2N8LDL2_9STRE|nr:transporter substrate-binding domain-containing protein [Streptococcus penaeicida]PND48242.1 amino acid ABC transporter substrate-binding protein [Streptococcus penaeicida]